MKSNGYYKKIKCLDCGVEFFGYANKKYCSKECLRSANNKLSEKTIMCSECGEEFRTKHHKTQKFCSQKCWNKNKTRSNTKEVYCIKCGKTFLVKQSRLNKYNVSFCSMECYGREKHSSYEYTIIDEIGKFYSGNIVHGHTPHWLGGQEVDIYIPDKKIAIEINGLFWHSEFGGNKGSMYHLSKTKSCSDNGIRLIHLFTDEIEENLSAIIGRLKNLLIKSDSIEYARNCSVVEISRNDAKDFLSRNHTQKYVNSSIRIGLIDSNGNIVSVMTFGKSRRVLGSSSIDGTYELIRFASSKNVVGGFSKMMSFFENNYSPKKIISYMDIRWNSDIIENVYTKNGFEYVHTSKPNFWYTKDYIVREHRFKYRKSELVKMGHPKNKSEREIMVELGYDRIYDCGSAKFMKVL